MTTTFMTDSMHIRPFQESDRQAVVSLWTDCELVRPWNDPWKDIDRKLAVGARLFFVGMLDTDTDANANAVGSSGGDATDRLDGLDFTGIAGTVMAGYDGHRGWVNYLAVSPHCRGYGFGARLMQHAEQQLLALGCPKLNLQVRSSNAAVIAFYQHLGYQIDDAVSLGKRLIPDL